MINKEAVETYTKVLGDFSDEEIETYSPVIDYAITTTAAALKDSEYGEDGRAVFLAAARANSLICTLKAGNDDVTSFTAGDVSIKRSGEACSKAAEILNEALTEAHGLIGDGAFAFIGV